MTIITLTTASLNLVSRTRDESLAMVDALSEVERAMISPEWLDRVRNSDLVDPFLHGFAIVHRASGETIGHCGFKGPPAADGVVELAYAVSPAQQGRGFATEAARAAVAFALEDDRVRLVRAHTLPEENASTHVLLKNGFRKIGEVIDPEDGLVWRWELTHGAGDTHFTPSFKHFQTDIERYLERLGKAEKNEHGQTVYHGYQDALALMYRSYLEKGAFAPLVAEFRKWNWEWGYSEYLLELSERLRKAEQWPLLRELWAGVIAKRRTNYNKTKKAQRAVPEKIPQSLVIKTRELLLESLYDLQRYASELHQESDVSEYAAMIERAERGITA